MEFEVTIFPTVSLELEAVEFAALSMHQ